MEQAEEIKYCPLCGNPEATKESILSHILQESGETNDQFSELLINSRVLKENIKELEKKIESSKLKQILLKRIQTAYKAADLLETGRTQDLDTIALNELEYVKYTLDTYEELVRRKEELMEYRIQWEKEIKQYVQQIRLEELRDIPGLIKKTQIFISKVNENYICDEHFSPLAEELEKVLATVERYEKIYEEKMEGYNRELELAVKNEKKAEEDLIEYRSKLEKWKKKKEDLQRIRGFWESVNPILKIDSGMVAASLYGQVQGIRKLLKEEENSRSFIGEKKMLEEAEEHYRKLLEGYKKIESILGCLQSREKYAKDFVSENIRHISNIFLNLHSPREFSELRLDKNDQLVAIRKKEEVPVYKLSTGQKTAVALSVFFKMNLSTENAPEIIMLDEPVSNIDDMNILAMLDFLREIALTTNRQIFFTTANHNVAKLFRRKFSCMEESFQEISFNRKTGMRTQMILKEYDMKECVKREEL